ncbi:DUF6153 family protein [Streptomyces fulvoviolaceus]|uniref:DUF6153 family protein n=1 Tax=Streptomyces fulvoviolaceus TaxID=285535 RepID=UPI0021BDF38E|nr:DUF6153 family protein [Streptomyces fulvoviolaceus]MCT9082816.1 DUF6153 family protein [Streptomyces fulvoviolaceus]
MTGSRRATYGRLLLFAVLLLGVVTMHTLGHPSEHGSGAHSSVAMPESVVMHESVVMPEGHAPAASSERPPMDGMDPSSMCLAVLGAFTLVLLLSTALGGTRPGHLRPPSLTRLLRALWPNPPPPRRLLSRLSVLRI